MIQERFGKSGTVWSRWYENARNYSARDAIVHWVAGEEPYRWTFSSLLQAAEAFSVNLIERGIKQGDVCAIILRHNKNLYPLYLGVSWIGAIPAILAYPNPRLHPDKFRQGIEGMSQRSGLNWILTEPDLEAKIRPLIDKDNCTIKGLHFPLEWRMDKKPENEALATVEAIHSSADGSGPFLLQHSSGTTGLQKPVLLSHRAVIEHVQRYSATIGLSEADKVVSWLPLYHDMGLIAAFHLPLVFGIPSIQLDPFEWVQVPSLLLEAISREGGTVSWLPNFAYNMMADKITDDELAGIDLQSWRMIINCSEPVRHESHQKFLKRFRPYGLRRFALSACYAMAETTFAVTQTPPDSEPASIAVDRMELSKGKVQLSAAAGAARICVSSGKPIEGCEIRIVDESHNDLPDGMVGEIAITSVSLFDGYRNYPEKTAEVMRDGWYHSGDYGFTLNGECYVIGRKKDLIIVAGNNIYPEDIEDAVGKVEGVIPGRVVAFGEENKDLGSEQVSVVAETAIEDEAGQKALRLAVIKAAMSIDVSIANVYLVPSRWLIKSSAGKPSRKANKERILMAGGLELKRT
jgi:acyl-CoA synthetase (AMP-forming)/AMP-acid ligase II